jgi:hypothetical protein
LDDRGKAIGSTEAAVRLDYLGWDEDLEHRWKYLMKSGGAKII